MRVVIKTEVKGNYLEVMKRFDIDLFEFLKPASTDMEVEKFTGSKTGDEVHLKFNSPFKMKWVSHITDHGQDEKRCFFLDEGVILPFPLGFWQHRHIVENHGNNCVIVDDMSFRAKWRIFTVFLYPAILFGFLPRKKAYRKYFGEPV